MRVLGPRRRTVGVVAGLFSVFVGSYFALGLADRLPDLQQIFGFVASNTGS